MAFSTKIKGHHHLQGNVQVYNVRIPVLFPIHTRSLFGEGGVLFAGRGPHKCPKVMGYRVQLVTLTTRKTIGQRPLSPMGSTRRPRQGQVLMLARMGTHVALVIHIAVDSDYSDPPALSFC